MYPKSNFTRKTIYNLWHGLDEVTWKRDDDPFKSAEKLLDGLMNEKSGGLYRPHHIQLKTQCSGFQALAWSLPSLLLPWKGRICELALDSACEHLTLFDYFPSFSSFFQD